MLDFPVVDTGLPLYTRCAAWRAHNEVARTSGAGLGNRRDRHDEQQGRPRCLQPTLHGLKVDATFKLPRWFISTPRVNAPPLCRFACQRSST